MRDSEGEKGPRLDATIRVELAGHEKPSRCMIMQLGRQQRLTSTERRATAARQRRKRGWEKRKRGWERMEEDKGFDVVRLH